MKPLTLAYAALAAILTLLLPAAPAQAQNFKSFVSSTGDDTHDCSFANPCRLLQRAHDQTAPGGQIGCLDSGDFFGASIIKTITIDCAGTSATANTFSILGAGVVVTIRNLTLASDFGFGIDFQNGAALFVENCTIKGAQNALPLAIRFQPSAPGSQLVVSDTIIKNNGNPPSTGGG